MRPSSDSTPLKVRWLPLILIAFLTAWGGDDEKIPVLIERLGDRDWKVREKAEAQLLSRGEEAEEALRKALDHPDAEVRWRAEKLLRKLRWRVPKELEGKVGRLFDDYDDLATADRLQVVEMVADRLGAEGVALLLRIGREDVEPQVREMALRGAHGLGGDEVVESILKALGGEDRFWAHRWAAELHSERGEVEESLEACRAATRQNPHDPELNALYIRLLMEGDLWEEATSVLETLKGSDPKNPLYRMLLGKAYGKAGREEEADEERQRAVEMEPESLEAYLTLIRECLGTHELDLALRFMRNSEANYPGDLGILALKGEVQEAREDWDGAFRTFSFLYQSTDEVTSNGKENPDWRRWREKLREVLEERGEGDLVTDDLLDAIHRPQIPVGLWKRLGEIYRERSLRRYAVEELRRTLIFMRGDPDLLLQLAEVYHEMGDRERSRETAKKALEVEDISPGYRKHLEDLRDGKAPLAPPTEMAPLLWEWKVQEGDEWVRSPDRNEFSWKIPPVRVRSTLISPVHGSDTVVGVDLSTGESLWRVDPPEPPPPPESRVAKLDLAWVAAEGESVYLLYNVWHSLPGKFRVTKRKSGLLGMAVDPARGEIVGRFELEAPIDGEPSNTAPGGLLAYARQKGLSGGRLALVDLPGGRVRWSRRVRSLSDLPPHIGSGRVWLGLHGGALVGLDLETGEEGLKRSFGSPLTTPPLPGPKGIFLATSRGRLLRWEEGRGEPTWEVEVAEIVSGMGRLPEDRLLTAHRGGGITCWDADSGDRIWEARPGRAAERAFVGHEGLILSLNGGRNSYVDEQAEVIAIVPADGSLRWRVPGEIGGDLVLAGDQVILVEGDIRRRGFRLTSILASEEPPGADEIARTLLVEARSRAGQGEKEVAAALMRRVIALSEKPEHYLDLARILMAQGELERAQEAIERGGALEGADREAFESLTQEVQKALEARLEARRSLGEVPQDAAQEGQEEEEGGGEEEEPGEDPPEEEVPEPPPDAPRTCAKGISGR